MGDHVVRISLLDFSGKELDGFTRNRTSRAGELDEAVFIPYNIPAGEYSLIVRDVISGMEAMRTLDIGQ